MADTKLKFLVTNDDGVWSRSLWTAVEALIGAGDVFVVAPDREQNGVGTSMTLHAPIRTHELAPPPGYSVDGVKTYAIEGTPADSTILALEHLVGPVDLVVSGINRGSNLGEDVTVSGTVGAALQGYVRGYPSIAISVGPLKDTRFEVASSILSFIAAKLAAGVKLPPALININLPNEPGDKIEGVQVTRLGKGSYRESVKEGSDGRRKYFWISRDRVVEDRQPKNSDVWAVRHNRISITPLHTGLTADDHMPAIERLFGEYVPGS